MKLPSIFNLVAGFAEGALVTHQFKPLVTEESDVSEEKIFRQMGERALKEPVTDQMKFTSEQEAVEHGKTTRNMARLAVELGEASLKDAVIDAIYPKKCLTLRFNSESAHQAADRREFRKTGTTPAARIIHAKNL